jgi:two-component system, NarL family, sensor kinase
LPKRSILLYVWQQALNEQGKILESADILALIAQSAPVPIYGMSGLIVGNGIVGGYITTSAASGTKVAEIALRVVNGARAQDIPVERAPTIPLFDWRQLQHWGISEAGLPAGSVVRFKQLSLWEGYKWRIIGVISLCLIQAGLIAILLIERSRRRWAKEALDDRLRFETLLSDLSADFTDLRHDEADSKIKEWLQRLVEFLGVDRGSFLTFLIVGEKVHHRHSYSVPAIGHAPEISLQEGMAWYVEQLSRGTVLNYSQLPDQLPTDAACEKQRFREAGLKSHLAVPMLSGGSVVYVLSFTTLHFHRTWSEDLVARLRVVGEIFANALKRKQAEEDLVESHARIEDLAGRLIVAHEDERKNIARELHDDINQHVAALAISLSRLERQLPHADDPIRAQITKLEWRMKQLSERIRQLSHQLHSATLEHVGLPEALKLHCSDFSDREGISVTLNIPDGIEAIPADAALCIYRVAQESLRNIAKHSGAKTAEVMLNSTNDALELRVADHGMGFDLENVRLRRGLGLVSIEERVKLLHGSFEVTSQLGSGTELRVHLPLRSSV